MESSLPFAFRVAAGLLSETLSAVRRLPTEISTLPVTVVGQVAKFSFQLNHQLTELATAGDHLLASLHTAEPPPERTAWSTIDDEDDVAAKDPQAAATWDEVQDAVDDATPGTADVATVTLDDDELAAGLISTTDELEQPLLQDVSAVVGDRPVRLVSVPDPDARPPADISSLTIAQLRSRVRSMSAETVRAALEQEQTGKARPAFLTVLTNRLTTLARTAE